jgi:3-deoxy-D-manno-octulosonic-acid transferase
MPLLLDALYLLALVPLAPWLAYKAATTGKYRRGLAAKLLGFNPELRTPNSELLRPVWFHGVSVGEVHLLRQVVAAFRRRHPGRAGVVSTTTDTGFDEARRCFPDLAVFYFPFDFSWAVRRTLARVNPSLVVLAEGELWPNFLLAARERGVPVAVVNGRMSPRSLGRYRRLGTLARRLVRAADLLAVQTDDYAAAFRALGADPARVRVTGSVKYDGAAADHGNPKTEALRHLFGLTAGDLVWVAGSTQAPEEEIALSAYRRLKPEFPSLRLILVPRQKDRFDEVARLLERGGLPFVRRSSLPPSPVTRDSSLVLVDTIGELGAVWGLADVAFVGGSLDGRRGGQNMIEPAAYGAAVVFGPHVWNFREPAGRLVAEGAAVQVADAAGLEAAVRRLLGDAAERARLGAAARRFVQAQQGATERTVALLGEMLARREEVGRAG